MLDCALFSHFCTNAIIFHNPVWKKSRTNNKKNVRTFIQSTINNTQIRQNKSCIDFLANEPFTLNGMPLKIELDFEEKKQIQCSHCDCRKRCDRMKNKIKSNTSLIIHQDAFFSFVLSCSFFGSVSNRNNFLVVVAVVDDEYHLARRLKLRDTNTHGVLIKENEAKINPSEEHGRQTQQ